MRIIFRTLTLAVIMAAGVLRSMATELPTDPIVRRGVLPNGLTYYIAHNEQTPHVADFYIAQRVGSVLEEPRQRGLAHFLEHMAFNGSRHFPGGTEGQGIVSWCESVGIKFGANLNAYTSVDETVYNISAAPVVRQSVVDSCLLILSDWSHDLLLTDEEIDKERGVVHEEWRTRRAGMAMQRLMEDAMPVLFAGSKYADALPIGSMDIIDHFPYQDLRDYYHKWYRPDLQAIIVVGDIDVDYVEGQIKRLFSSIETPKDAAERQYYPVPDNDRMILFTASDREQPTTAFTLYMKRDTAPRAERNTAEEYAASYRADLVRAMLAERFDAIERQAEPPFISASARDGQFFIASTKDAFSLFCVCKPDDILGGISAAVAETERARQHGFTLSELQRAKAEQLRYVRNAYAERDKRRNSRIVSACVSHFTDGEPMLSPADELALVEKLDSTVTLADVNATARELISDRNQAVTFYGPEKEGITLPSRDEIEQTVLKAQAASYEAPEDKPLPSSLMTEKPKAGSIVKEEEAQHGYTCLMLSNGMRVYVLPTDYEADDVSLQIVSPGGRSLYPDTDIPSLTYTSSVIAASGIGPFDAATLEKMLAGHTVSLYPFISDDSEGMRGSSTVADTETLLQLAHLYFTQPRRDDEAFASLMSRQRSFLANRNASPTVAYNDSLRAILYDNNPRMAPTTLETLPLVSHDRILEIYRERFADASDFDVVLTGNLDLATLRPLLCTYLASLPSTYSHEVEGEHATPLSRRSAVHRFSHTMATPSSTTSIYITADLPYTADNDMQLDVLSQLLRMVYTEKVREEKGGTYGVSVSAQTGRWPREEALLKISFRCDPSRYDELIPIVYQALDDMAQDGPSEEALSKVKEYERKTYGQVKIMNAYWEQIMLTQITDGIDIDHDYTSRIDAITPAQLRDLARTILNQRHRIEVTMTSE